ncbi:MAG: alpha/beta hydrolase [Peptococcaceae bacterium]|nr:alpha/beta hydrolase [Peptococcaceae bacterium]
MLYGTKEHTLEISDTQIDYITFGYGTKPLVMIQGLNTRGIKGMAPALAYMYRIFAKEYKVYLFDRRANIPATITVQALAEDIALAMDALQITNADILGVSQGGMIAQYLAIDRPDLVHKLVLAVTLARNNNTVQSVINHWTSLTEQGKMRELVADMADKMYSERYMKRYRPMLPLLTILQTPKDVSRFITLAKACLTCNTYDDLHKIICPVLVIGARQDKIVGSSASEEIAAKLGCECYMYEGLGHAAYEEAKDFNKRVYAFLKKY